MLDILQDQLKSIFHPADLSIFHEFTPPPTGGGHQFLRALWRELELSGLKLENNSISYTTRACLMNSFNFSVSQLKRRLRKNVLCVHRMDGPVDVYRGRNDGVDRDIWLVNHEFSDRTIFQSRYSLEKHLELGLEFREPTIIPNAADPLIFYSHGRISFSRDRKIRLIASSWSDNINKGAPVYQWLDENLNWERYELTFVGRSPIQFRNIRMVSPVNSLQMGELFRQNDIYVTASKNDPCSNSLIEALSCGLPSVFLQSGGHPEIVKEAGFGFHEADEIPALLDRLVDEYELRHSKISPSTLKEVSISYLKILELI